MTEAIRLLSVNVGTPAVLGERQGETVWSAIRKRPVAAPVLWLGALNLAGDGQADRQSHGGPDKAVYAYPSEHLAAWSRELGESLGPAAFGENLTVAGAVEDAVRVGDVWAWGDALLQVSQPRWPCYKLAMHRRRPDMVDRFVSSRRCGWYLRVLRPGEVAVAGCARVVERDASAVSVARAFRAAVPRAASAAEIAEVLGHPALAEGWRRTLQRRLPVAENAPR